MENKVLKDEELKEVTGGTDNSRYKYVILSGSFVFEFSDHLFQLEVCEDVKTNDSSYVIHCKKVRVSNYARDSIREIYRDMRVSMFIDCYINYGGAIHGMTIEK